jgi:hypothetical protein
VAVSGLSGVTITQISASGYSVCALSSTGVIYCWGLGTSGQLGNGATATSKVPVAVTASGVLAGATVTQIDVGGAYACALSAAGAVYCWGDNTYGELGNATTTSSNVPVAVTTGGAVVAAEISVGGISACALSSAGAAYCWGDDSQGEIGTNTAATTTPQSTPAAVYTGGVLAGVTLTQISVGSSFACAVSAGGVAYCWGLGTSDQLGNSGTTSSTVPVAVTATSGTVLYGVTLTQISTGQAGTCVLSAAGTASCWGNDNFGMFGNNSTTAASAAVLVGPQAPTGVTATGGNTTAAVSWTAPAYLNTATLSSYAVSSTPGTATCTTTGTTTCTLTGLTNGTTYTVTVTDTTTTGTSAPSSPATAEAVTSSLTIVKTANVRTVAPGGTVLLHDHGDQLRADRLHRRDVHRPADQRPGDDAVYNANAAATAGTVSYTSPNLTWTGNLAVGATATITYSVTVNSPDTGSGILANTVTSTTAGSNCASGSGNAACTATVTVSGLTIVKTANATSRRAARWPTRSR